MIDSKLLLSDAQDIGALTASSDTDSTNVIDLTIGENPFGTAKIADPSAGGRMRIVARVVEEELAAAVDGAVLTLSLFEHTAASSVASGNLIAATAPLTVNTTGTGGVPIGTVLMDMTIPVGVVGERYLGGNFNVITQALGSGKIQWEITDHIEFRVDE